MFGDPLDPIAAEWRAALERVVSWYTDCALLLSGGADSMTILAAMLSLGVRPPCYTFRVGTMESKDLKVARKVCKDFGLRLNVSQIRRTFPQLRDDVYELIGRLRTSRKVSVQVTHGGMYMYKAIARDGLRHAIIGTGCICLDDRDSAVLWRKQGEAAVRDYRREKLEDRWRYTGVGHQHMLARMLGVTLEEPYSTEPLRSAGLALDYAELNRPVQKGITLRAYPGFWRGGYYKHNDPLQVGTGLRAWHDTLLASPLNKRGMRSVVAVYNDILKELKESNGWAKSGKEFFHQQANILGMASP